MVGDDHDDDWSNLLVVYRIHIFMAFLIFLLLFSFKIQRQQQQQHLQLKKIHYSS